MTSVVEDKHSLKISDSLFLDNDSDFTQEE